MRPRRRREGAAALRDGLRRGGGGGSSHRGSRGRPGARAGEGGGRAGEAAAAAQQIRPDGVRNQLFLPDAMLLVSSGLGASTDAVSCKRNRFLVLRSLSSLIVVLR